MRKPSKNSVVRGATALVMLLALTLMAGCGQKGPLKLPAPAGAASGATK
ncbi:LPS translocon maturation chaperone LptM [Rubrivivax gelatinosus]|nr:lipoprotein [Rubrivivax gelatinosus]